MRVGWRRLKHGFKSGLEAAASSLEAAAEAAASSLVRDERYATAPRSRRGGSKGCCSAAEFVAGPSGLAPCR